MTPMITPSLSIDVTRAASAVVSSLERPEGREDMLAAIRAVGERMRGMARLTSPLEPAIEMGGHIGATFEPAPTARVHADPTTGRVVGAVDAPLVEVVIGFANLALDQDLDGLVPRNVALCAAGEAIVDRLDVPEPVRAEARRTLDEIRDLAMVTVDLCRMPVEPMVNASANADRRLGGVGKTVAAEARNNNQVPVR